MGWLRSCSEIGPVRVLDLSDVSQGLKREMRMLETEVADDYDWVFVGFFGILALGFFAHVYSVLGRFDWSAFGFNINVLLGVGFHFERSVICG